MQLKELVTECVEQTFSASYASKFSGYDPFDGLNSRVFNVFPPLKNSLFGLAIRVYRAGVHSCPYSLLLTLVLSLIRLCASKHDCIG